MGLEGIPLDKPLFAVSIRSIPLQPQLESELFKALAEKLDWFISKYKLQPVFLLFQCPEDMRQASQVIDAMKGKSHVVFRICRPQEMLDLFPHLNLLIGMRLHSLIFAALNAVPMLGISYDPKVGSFAESIDQPCIRLDESGKIGDLLDGIMARRDLIRKNLEGGKKLLREKAQLNFDLFFEKFGKPTIVGNPTIVGEGKRE